MTSPNITAQGNITTNAPGVGNTVAVSTSSYGSGIVQLAGTWTGTITFEGTIDGVNYVPVAATPLVGGASVSSATGNGIWRLNAGGLFGIRARGSAAMTGSAAVSLSLSQYGAGGI